MNLIVGLGNPGDKYLKTRHNLGQELINRYLDFHHLSLSHNTKFKAYLVQDGDNLFATLDLFMNESGIGVQKLVNFYRIDPSAVYVVHDDLDIGVGDYKIQFAKSSAGHKGIESIISHLNTKDFYRIRIGIGKPLDTTPIESYVLLPFTASERAIIDPSLDKLVVELDHLLGH